MPREMRGYDYTYKSMLRRDNVGGLGKHVTCMTSHGLVSKSTFFLSLFLGSRYPMSFNRPGKMQLAISI